MRGLRSAETRRGLRACAPQWHRRRALQAVGAAILVAGSTDAARAAESAPRIVALNWAFAEILLTLDVAPIAVNDRFAYGRTVSWPAMPPAVVDVGIGGAPNFEALHAIRPDRILITPAQDYLRAALSKIAPVESIGLFMPDGEPYRRAAAATLRIADDVGARPKADDLLAGAAGTIDQARSALRDYRGAPVYLLGLLDNRHARVFGRRSLFQDVLGMLGLRNAWTGSTNEFGFATIGIEMLAQEQDARIVNILPLPVAARSVTESAFWRNLPAVNRRGVTTIGPVWPFGGVATAARFAGLLVQSLSSEPA